MTDVCTVKKSNLVLPSTYYELDREEMSYVEGGAQAYYGTDAILVIGQILGASAKLIKEAVKSFRTAITSSSVGIGIAIGVATAFLSVACIGFAGLNLAMGLAAFALYCKDGGFKASSFNILFWKFYIVEEL